MSSVGDSVADWLVKNRDNIERGVEIIGQASEVLASTVGQFHPILEAVFVAASELLSNPDSREARYLTQQFELVNKKLEGIEGEIKLLVLGLQESAMNTLSFDHEVQMISQYDKFQEFVNADPKFKEKKMKKFLNHYECTDADMNLDALYNAVTGENLAGDPILDTVVEIKQRSRREVEVFCAQLKKLFVVGIIAVMGHAALKEGAVGEEMVKRWQDRMENVESRMKAAVDDCTVNFVDQAKLDLELKLQDCPKTINTEYTQSLLDSLVQKYDWVCWSIRAFNEKERFFLYNWLAGKNYHGILHAKWFEILTKNNIKVVVSFCVDPQPINKQEIHKHIEQQKLKGNMTDVGQALSATFPSCLVHVISKYKEMVETNNFQPECYYFGRHRQFSLCIHPE